MYSNCDKKKTFVLVKLTDSALNAIENHLTSNHSTTLPNISFKSDKNEGVLSFPDQNSGRRFTFNLSNVEAGGPQGSFECLHQSVSGFESLGTIAYKMQIHAGEDVYERTKERMAENQMESKKYCIKNIGTNVGSKVKKITARSGAVSNSNSGGGGGGGSSNSSNSNSNSNCNNNSSSNHPRPLTSSSNPALMKRSLRERVIHLLALRPYKKPELLARLNRDGIKDKDKKHVSQVFNMVSKLKENAFNLASHAWNEVRVDDWPFYTQEQRDIVRKRKEAEIQQRSSTTCNNTNNTNNINTNINTNTNSINNSINNSISNNHNNHNTHNTHNTPNAHNTHNNHSNHNHNHNNNNHNTNTNTNNNNSSFPSSANKRSAENVNPGSIGDKKQRLSAKNIITSNHNSTNNANNLKSDPRDIMSEWSIKPRICSPNSSPDSGTGSNDGNLSSKSNCELPDYAIRYVGITSYDQLRKYKDEFNREYKEYRQLHRDIDLVAQKFSAYEVKLKSLPEGSDEWNKTLDQVFKEYDNIKKDFKYLESKQRATYLHKKLSHIKKLIQEFLK